MRPNEAKWVEEILAELSVEDLSPLLELGSSTKNFREIEKPHIEQHIHRPLRERGVVIVTTDLKSGDGIDISGDVYDPATARKLRSVSPRCILVCNIFEHLIDPPAFARFCANLVVPGGRVVVTVPYSYPYHLDPIDTLFRPNVSEIAGLFPDFEIEVGQTINDNTYWQNLRRSRGRFGSAAHITKALRKSLLLRGGIEASKARLHRLLWLARPYTVTAVLLRKNPTQEADEES